MGGYAWWFVAGFGLLIAELLSGTFYLLVIALAAGGAGVAALLGAGFTVQLVVAAIIGFSGSLWLRRSRAQHKGAASAALQNLDVGQPIRIDQWTNGRTARATYRGAQWDVELAGDGTAEPGEFLISDMRANRLIVRPRR
jgi:membrane protein implicated in regulation of membrane protease activity